MVGRAKRGLSCFVMTLSYSRALYLEFFFDQTMENFLRGHVHAFEYWHGQPRVILYDNLKSAVLERRGNQIVDSGRCRSVFRNDVDQDYDLMPITIPTRSRSQIA